METFLRTARRVLLAAAGAAVVVVPTAAVLAPSAASASTPMTALINTDSVTTSDGITNSAKEPISLEQWAAENAGYKVTLASGAEWEAMSTAQFANYQVLIVGDPNCSSMPESVEKSSAAWVPAVMGSVVGNRVVVGTDPEDHYQYGNGHAPPREEGNPASAGAEHLVQDGITYAGGRAGATGIYIDTSCEGFHSPERDQALLNRISSGEGSWEQSATGPSCGQEVRQIGTNAAFNSGPTKLLDEDIQGWSCSAHVSFTKFPSDWVPIAITIPGTSLEAVKPAVSSEAPVCGSDIESGEPFCGQAYVLAAGVGLTSNSPDLALEPLTGEAPAGGDHAVTATVTKPKIIPPAAKAAVAAAEREPVAGAKVSFAISGTNNGVKGTCTLPGGAADPGCETNAEGKVIFTYHDANGAGPDTIGASVEIEGTLQHSTASMNWTPVPPAPAPPAPPVRPKTEVLAFGSAKLASGHACVASTGYLASVSGSQIASVTYSLNGHKLGTVTKASHGVYSYRVHVKTGKAQHLTIKVSFTSASKTKALTFTRTLARCAAAKKIVLPRFTG